MDEFMCHDEVEVYANGKWIRATVLRGPDEKDGTYYVHKHDTGWGTWVEPGKEIRTIPVVDRLAEIIDEL
jgi:hypothetical protein